MPKFNFEKYWQRIIGGIDETPPESVWENIQDELDIDEVWTKIDQNIPAASNYWQNGLEYLAKVAALVLLLFIPSNNSDMQGEQVILSDRSLFSNQNYADSLAKANGIASNSTDLFPGKINEARPSQKKPLSERDSVPLNQITQKELDVLQNDALNEDERTTRIETPQSISPTAAGEDYSISQNLQNSSLAASEQKLVDAEDLVKDDQITSSGERLAKSVSNEVDSLALLVATKIDGQRQYAENHDKKGAKKAKSGKNRVLEPYEEENGNEKTIDSDAIGMQSLLLFQKIPNRKPIFASELIIVKDSIVAMADINDKGEDEALDQALRFRRVGVNAALKNSRLLNNETRAANSGNSLASTSFTLVNDFGLSMQWETRRKQMLQFSYYFVSESAQAYNQYIEARYRQRKLKINYQTIALEFIQPLQVIDASLTLGPYISRIQSVEESIGTSISDFTRDYKNWEYGFNVGFQYHYQLSQNLSVQPSVKLQYGLNNIFRGDNLIPANFNNTNPVNLSFGIGIYYNLIR